MSPKNLSKTKLSVLVFSLSVLFLTAAFFLSGLTWKQIVAAFSTKSPGSNLTSGDWNGLLGDFVKKSGDTMSGPLTVPQINASKVCMGGICKTAWPSGSKFGGMYELHGGGCCRINPYTGSCSCPSGYYGYGIGIHGWCACASGVTNYDFFICYKP